MTERLAERAPAPCGTCGSPLFWKSAGEFRCAKHDPPPNPIGEQFYVTKAGKSATKGEQVEPMLNLKRAFSPHTAVQAAKAMTGPVVDEGFLPSSDRDVYGRVVKQEEEKNDETSNARDMYGRRRKP